MLRTMSLHKLENGIYHTSGSFELLLVPGEFNHRNRREANTDILYKMSGDRLTMIMVSLWKFSHDCFNFLSVGK